MSRFALTSLLHRCTKALAYVTAGRPITIASPAPVGAAVVRKLDDKVATPFPAREILGMARR